MGDSETFANELDRRMAPYLEWLDSNGLLANEEEDSRGESDGGRIYRDFDDLRVSIDWGNVDRPGLIYVTRPSLSVGNVLYERFQGRTETFHPGEWVNILVGQIIDMQADDQKEEIASSLVRVLEKFMHFVPV